jgi:hypothetical protein
MQKPEIVYDEPSTDGCRHRWFGRCCKNQQQVRTSTIQTASVLMPTAFASGIIGQGFAFNGFGLQTIAPQVTSFGAQSLSGQGIDLAGFRAAQDLHLGMVQLSAYQAQKDLERRTTNAFVQRIRAELNSIAPQDTGVTPSAAESENCCNEIKKGIKEIRDKIDGLQAQLTDIQKHLPK